MRTERVVSGVRPDAVAVDPMVIVALERDRGQALFGFARRLGLGDDQAADAVQETLLRLWRELTRGITVDDPAAWSFRTLYRICMDEHRLRRRVAALAESDAAAGIGAIARRGRRAAGRLVGGRSAADPAAERALSPLSR